ncbi:flagellar motor protein MotB [Fredinandcohnia quinoae]|uniref:Flagellar motor protein MotB n=1 Tax=Fredinandcohnia quinoae TaxID=2918902 RepID=A0AAW5EE95_9BACI|nr:flagellar motor protein MotB [Fredinandcohnia sp. SECRCQ15]MCH1627806.1 flagellar motor protein MotB [Fredinandcohnia sp. SECRCQ15]
MAKKKKHKVHHEEHVDESWLVPYADILTLLLALFIVLFASSSIDVQKFTSIAQSFSSVLNGGTSVLEMDSIEPKDVDSKSKGKEAEKKEDSAAAEQEELKQVQEKINNYIHKNQLEISLKTKLTDEGLLVTLQDDAFFDSGSATVRSEDAKLAREISELLVMNPPRNIIVSGHTDNVPMHSREFSDNWHLSVIRAINFMKILLENDKLDPRLFSAKGFGEFEPVASNDTAQGKQKNRRVEILILPNVKE